MAKVDYLFLIWSKSCTPLRVDAEEIWSLYVCIYTHNEYLYVCIYTCIYMYICTNLFIYIFIYIYIYIYIYVYTYIYIYIYMYIYIYVYIYSSEVKIAFIIARKEIM